jgi:hypothetical protein
VIGILYLQIQETIDSIHYIHQMREEKEYHSSVNHKEILGQNWKETFECEQTSDSLDSNDSNVKQTSHPRFEDFVKHASGMEVKMRKQRRK